MAELLATMRRHRQAIFALAMIVIVVGLLWTARGALPAFFIGPWRSPSCSIRW